MSRCVHRNNGECWACDYEADPLEAYLALRQRVEELEARLEGVEQPTSCVHGSREACEKCEGDAAARDNARLARSLGFDVSRGGDA